MFRLLTSFLLLLEVLVIAVKPVAVATTRIQNVIMSDHNEKDILTNTKRDFSDQDTTNGCKFGDCYPYIIDHVLGNLTSNSVIKITQDVILSSTITLANLTNVSLIGYNNPMITCHKGITLQISFSHSFAIEGITWDQCGTRYLGLVTTPGIQFQYSSNITVKNCSFQHSEGRPLALLNASNITVKECSFQYSSGQALALSDVSGDVNIQQSKFVHCLNSGGYGGAIYYSSSDPQLAFIINDCEFSHNNGKTVVHVGESTTYVTIKNCAFYKNKGVPIYISSKGLKIDGYLLMEENSATNGGAIFVSYSDHTSRITFCKNSTAIFNSNFANRYGGAIYIDGNAIVLFNETAKITFYNNRAAKDGGAVFATNSTYIAFEGNSVVYFTENSASCLGGAMYLQNTKVTFIKSTVMFDNNYSGENGGAVFASRNCEITMKENSTVTFRRNKAEISGGAIRGETNCSFVHNESKVTFIYNNANSGGAVIITINSHILFGKSAVAVFINNTATEFFGAIWVTENSNFTCEADSNVRFSFNTAGINGGAISLFHSSVMFTGSSVITFNGNDANDYGGAMYLSKYCDVTVKGNSKVIFQNNKAENGGAMHLNTYSSFVSKKYSIVKFTDNSATEGGAVNCNGDSIILLDENTLMNFSNNTALNGGAIAIKNNCDLTFKGRSEALFNSNRNSGGNSATNGFGGAVYTNKYSDINFLENSDITFSNNTAKFAGGAIFSQGNNIITTHDYSSLIFKNNQAESGASVRLGSNSTFNVDGNSNVIFSDNIAIGSGTNTGYGGAIELAYSMVDFKGNTTVLFIRNYVKIDGGAIFFVYSAVNFKGNAKVLFTRNNAAGSGAAMRYNENSYVQITENSVVTFSYNFAKGKGGALNVEPNGDTIITGNSVVTFISNEAEIGGAVFCTNNSNLTVDGNSTVRFLVNKAFLGGVLYIIATTAFFQGNSSIEFNGNSADVGGAVMAGQTNVEIVFKENCNVSFYNNSAGKLWAGAISLFDNSIAKHQGNSVVRFINNKAMYGGAIYCELNSNLIFDEESKVIISNNAAEYGGAVYLHTCTASVKGNSIVTFNTNRASVVGGAIYSDLDSGIVLGGNSSITFSDNYAKADGGAIGIDTNSYFTVEGNSYVMFNFNKAGNDGGAVHCDSNSSFMLTQNSSLSFQHNEAVNKGGAVTIVSNSNVTFTGKSSVQFNDNKATFGGAVYESDSKAIVNGNSTVKFNNNKASYGGSIAADKESVINFKGCSEVNFTNNSAKFYGGAIFSQSKSAISFDETPLVVFNYNTAQFEGGAISSYSSSVLFEQSSTIHFNNNQANYGESIISSDYSNVLIEENLKVKFNNNTARWYVGPPYSNPSYDVTFDNNGIVTCTDPQTFPVCIQEQCFCKTIDHALAYLTNNTSIKITTDVVLSSVVLLRSLQNISIVGQNNPTINCDGASGGIHLVSCHNCTIDGINWDGCGNKSHSSPTLKIEKCSSIEIKNCTFKHSMGQAIVFSEMSGDANIHHCKFMNNSNHIGYGAAICYSSYYLDSQLALTISNCNFTNNVDAVSIIYIELASPAYGISIINNSYFYDNQGISVFLSNQNLWIMGKSSFTGNTAENGAGIFATNHSTITFSSHSITTFDDNTAVNSGAAIYLTYYNRVLFEGKSQVSFKRNNATTGDGGAIYSYDNSEVIFKENSDIKFNYNVAKHGGALYSQNSDITIDQTCSVMFGDNTADYGGALYLTHHSNGVFTGSSSIKFQNNAASKYGGAVYIHNTCAAIFTKNTTVTFYNNSAKSNGGAIFIKINSNILLDEYSRVTFNNNRAQDTGGAISSESIPNDLLDENLYLKSPVEFINATSNKDNISFANLTFGGVTKVTFMNNNAAYGGAIFTKLDVIFTANSTSTFTNNRADNGGAFYCESNTNIVFSAESMVEFINNTASQDGGAVYSFDVTDVLFEESSSIVFNNNIAINDGGAICFNTFSAITFVKSNVTFQNNKAANGGAIYFEGNSSSRFGGISTVLFTNNEATQGGAIYSGSNSTVIFQQNCTTSFINNAGHEHGGAIFSNLNSGIFFDENSIVTYNNNMAKNGGGSIYSEGNSSVVCAGNSAVSFNSNTAHDGDGGAVYSNINSEMTFKDDCKLSFAHNYAILGGTVYSSYNSSITFDGNTSIVFNNNTAISGGAIYVNSHCLIVFAGNCMSTVKFNSNKAIQNGGAIQLETDSSVTVKGNTTVEFSNNEAVLGGAMYAYNETNVTIGENSTLTFNMNNAKMGGSIFAANSNIAFTGNCSINFYDNKAWQDGGAIYLNNPFSITFEDHTKLIFSRNTASDYGGAIYSKIADSKMIFHTTNFKFHDNNARTAGKSVFINVPTSCNSSCLQSSILGINTETLQHSQLNKHITTSPSKLELYQPAICIDENMNKTKECNSYYVGNIMLGQKVTFDACMYDYYDQPSDAARFVVGGTDNQSYYIPGSNYMLISCNNTFQGVALIGNDTSPVLPFNYSANITLHVDRISEMKTISINFLVELVSCHPGFWYNENSHKCECYNASDIVFCSGSSSTIKRGYWFGSVTGKPTVTFCPINYCNFACCEASNGYYHLSPVRDNQCRLHRSGTACGSCEERYTLSFDSTECLPLEKCTIGQTLLIITLTFLYWVVIIVAIFIIMHFKVDIGYLYGITYYYSIIDILLNQTWYLSNEFNTAISIASSITKITPRFLGQFCFVTGMSGIDQQFIHYMHPMAISVFLVMITILARRSRRLSYFISKGIIRIICCLLLLSYTSVATTSLLLMRPLIFLDVNKIYTFVSPDVQYLHGRHLAYVIVAVLFTIIIVIGLPLLLVLEPFLNSKINFTRIKPLLDQFQGSYKDKYRCFAGYYMICRLVIITIILVNSSDDFIVRYSLITACIIMSLIHQILRPYSNNFLNVFDGAVLHLIVLVSVLPLVEFFDGYDSNLLVGLAFALVALPSMIYIAMTLVINKANIKKLMKYCHLKWRYLRLRQRHYEAYPLDDDPDTSSGNTDANGNNRTITTTVCDT